ncbi:hypothetical protein Mgra_00009561 [Meloidogyne graminicola]|uniref:Uncharacterized protein n=1 Tax=Meloidogyne graminicola TaxID=189291 RepID=A0A8S9Z7J1_9BILA|nr:hypothetical protein Mgra_00009561 [Meloidogyne graminicola]
MIIFHPFLKRDLLRMLFCFRIFRPNIVEPINYNKEITSRTIKQSFQIYKQPKDINGNPLISVEMNHDLCGVHFKQLAILWK